MATRPGTVDYLLDQLRPIGSDRIRARRMFGEYCLYCDDKPVALICDDQLFLKPTEPARPLLREMLEGFPYPGAKPWWLISGDHWDDADWLSQLIGVTAGALPVPPPKTPRKPKPQSKPQPQPQPKSK